MKITTLIENTACRTDLTAEHGLSLYLETEHKIILFDTGQSGAFADNAERLGIDLRKVDLCVLSHGHYDHGGGLKRFLEINRHAPVYLSRHAFGEYFSSGNYIGLDPSLENNPRLIPVSAHLSLGQGLTLCTCNDRFRPHAFGSFGQTLRQHGHHVNDSYFHEQYLTVEEQGQKFCFSGCSHKGLLNILHWIQPDVFIGGFHFIRMDPQGQELVEAAKLLAAGSARYYTGHCTGVEQYRLLKEYLGNRLEYLHGGTVITL